MNGRELELFMEGLKGRSHQVRTIHRRLRLQRSQTNGVGMIELSQAMDRRGGEFERFAAAIQNVDAFSLLNGRENGRCQAAAIGDDETDRARAFASRRILSKHASASWITSSVLK